MSLNTLKALAAAFAASLWTVTAIAQPIAVPNADFNTNDDGDLLAIDNWETNTPGDVIQVSGAAGKDPGDLVASLGTPSAFRNLTTLDFGATYDTTELGYILTIEASAFNDAAFTDQTDAYAQEWGFLLRDRTNGNNIKTATQPNPLNGEWTEFTLYLTQEELLQYETDNGVDVDGASIAVRFFHNATSADDWVGVDNIQLSIGGAPVPGDVDGDGFVDLDDYVIIRDNLFGTSVSRSTGDVFPHLDADGVVDLADFALWKTEYLANGGSLAELEAFGAIPEPTSLVLLAIGALAAGRSRN